MPRDKKAATENKKRQVEELKATMATLREQTDKQREELETKTREIARLVEENRSLQDSVEELKATVARFREREKEKEGVRDALAKENARLRGDREFFTGENARLRRERDDARARGERDDARATRVPVKRPATGPAQEEPAKRSKSETEFLTPSKHPPEGHAVKAPAVDVDPQSKPKRQNRVIWGSKSAKWCRAGGSGGRPRRRCFRCIRFPSRQGVRQRMGRRRRSRNKPALGAI